MPACAPQSKLAGKLEGKPAMLKGLFQRKPDTAQSLYAEIVAAARRPRFYADMGVPDTVDGRFEMIALHMFLVLARLPADGKLSQQLVDAFFADMDRSLREMGVGDLSVGKKVRKMAESFYGRLVAYKKALPDAQELTDAIARNVFAGADTTPARALAQWLIEADQALAARGTGVIEQGRVDFP